MDYLSHMLFLDKPLTFGAILVKHMAYMVHTFVWPREAKVLPSPCLDTKMLALVSPQRPKFWHRPRKIGLGLGWTSAFWPLPRGWNMASRSNGRLKVEGRGHGQIFKAETQDNATRPRPRCTGLNFRLRIEANILTSTPRPRPNVCLH